MVKPSKKMQPGVNENVQNTHHRSKRDNRGGDEFHYYMKGKIGRQRLQFGANELPPPPSPSQHEKRAKSPRRDKSELPKKSEKYNKDSKKIKRERSNRRQKDTNAGVPSESHGIVDDVNAKRSRRHSPIPRASNASPNYPSHPVSVSKKRKSGSVDHESIRESSSKKMRRSLPRKFSVQRIAQVELKTAPTSTSKRTESNRTSKDESRDKKRYHLSRGDATGNTGNSRTPTKHKTETLAPQISAPAGSGYIAGGMSSILERLKERHDRRGKRSERRRNVKSLTERSTAKKGKRPNSTPNLRIDLYLSAPERGLADTSGTFDFSQADSNRSKSTAEVFRGPLSSQGLTTSKFFKNESVSGGEVALRVSSSSQNNERCRGKSTDTFQSLSQSQTTHTTVRTMPRTQADESQDSRANPSNEGPIEPLLLGQQSQASNLSDGPKNDKPSLRSVLPNFALSFDCPPLSQSSDEGNKEPELHIKHENMRTDVRNNNDVLTNSEHCVPLKRPANRPDLFFFGIIVKVNGYTNPDDESIKRLVQRHGGDFELYETGRVTHIIAEHLSKSKADAYRRQRDPRPVCLPSWITDSIQKKQLLPYADYLVPEIRDKQHGSLLAMLKKQSNKIEETNTNLSTSGNSNVTRKDEKRLATSSLPKTRVQVSGSGTKDSVQAQAGSSTEPSGIFPASDNSAARRNNSQTQSSHSKSSHAINLSSAFSAEASDLCSSHTVENNKIDTAKLISATNLRSSIAIPPMCTNNDANNDEDTCKSHEDSTYQTLDGVEPPVAGIESSNSLNQHVHHSLSPKWKTLNDSLNGLEALPKTPSPPQKSRADHGEQRTNDKIRTTGTDPHFLEKYFKNSRLCFIGSYKQRTSKIARQKAATTIPERIVSEHNRFVFHVDMDCFFAAVVLRKFPQYKGKPVVICHHGGDGGHQPKSISEESTSECATCSYEARQFGVGKGMLLGKAKRLCPNLIVLPYDFVGYDEVSEQVLNILYQFSHEFDGSVEAVSCDEAYVEVFLGEDASTAQAIAAKHAEIIRQKIFTTTGCTASIGVAKNKLLAKQGTDRAKPNGQYVVSDYRKVLCDLKLRQLPGIGYRSEQKLKQEGMVCVQDVWDLGTCAENELCHTLGHKQGQKVYSYCQGIDDRPVKPADRKTIGAECNYGVRFDGPYGTDHFFQELSKEVEKRMADVGVKGERLTLKVKRHKEGAGKPWKHLGHGPCHNLSRSANISFGPTRDATHISSAAEKLLEQLDVPTADIRGMGLVVSKLVADGAIASPSRSTITNWFGQRELQGLNDISESQDKGHIDGVGNEYSQRYTLDKHGLESPSQEPMTLWQAEGSPPQDSPATNPPSPDLIGADLSNSAEAEPPPLSPTERLSPIALPPLSQLHMSQVNALPCSLRDEIMHKVKAAESSAKLATTLADTNVEQNFFSEPETRKEKLPVTRRSPQVSISPALPIQYSGNGKSRFRQTSLKRMMRLASVKAGRESSTIALSQLDCLPLEIKLQVANGDDNPLGVLSQNPLPMTTPISILRKPKPGESKKKEHTRSVRYKDADGTEVDPIPEKSREAAVEKEEEYIPVDPKAFHREHVKPLMDWLTENEPPSRESIGLLGKYFHECVSEQRNYDTLRLFRKVRSRQDEWASPDVLREVADSIVKSAWELHRVRFSTETFLAG